jgi:hypothetical protein
MLDNDRCIVPQEPRKGWADSELPWVGAMGQWLPFPLSFVEELSKRKSFE